jgi:hypothetical protein
MNKLTVILLLLSTLAFQNCSDVMFSQEPLTQQGLAFREVLSRALVTTNTACVMCHTNIHGDVSGFGSMTFRNDSLGTITGNIYAADIKIQAFVYDGANVYLDPNYIDTHTNVSLLESVLPELAAENIVTNSSGQKVVRPGEKHNIFEAVSFAGGGNFYTLTENDANKRAVAEKRMILNPFTGRPIIHESDFPNLDAQLCADKAKGSITTGDGIVFKSPLAGHQIFVRGKNILTSALASQARNEYDVNCPPGETLTINGEVIIQGDLVISGCVQGHGTIYTNGNIYIPNDIKLKNSPFPFTRTTDETQLKGEAVVRAGADMLSFGSAGFVMIGSLKPEVFNHVEQDPHFRNNSAIYSNILNWLGSGTREANAATYYNILLKKPFGLSTNAGSVALIEANIYSNMGVAATLTAANRSNIVINGSIATPHLSLLAAGYAAGEPANAVNPFNGIPFHTTELNQDFRLKYLTMGYECQRAR